MTTFSSAPISLEDAKTLVTLIEQGENQQARALLDSATGQYSVELFAEVGKLTRQLHDSLNNFQLDDCIASMANEAIPDAKSRLIYVIEATEEAANKTMDLVDSCMPIAANLHSGMVSVLPDWKKLMNRQLQLGEFNQLCQRLDNILEKGSVDTGKLTGLLTEVVMAQGYQDLTGQVIRRVIELVKEVEDNLVYMLTMFGERESNDQTKNSTDQADSIKAEGPIVDAASRDDVASDQDDVDDLLSSLGF
ncbi:MAG: chemotaxis protein CheZ [Paraglaciecola sp.]|jgi:chemotaxis protein CheZ